MSKMSLSDEEMQGSQKKGAISIRWVKCSPLKSDEWSAQDNPKLKLNEAFHEVNMSRDGWGEKQIEKI